MTIIQIGRGECEACGEEGPRFSNQGKHLAVCVDCLPEEIEPPREYEDRQFIETGFAEGW
jgi:hypothetical protein